MREPFRFLYWLFLALLLEGCLREVPLELEEFESFLIVDATLTNELKQHEIILSKFVQGGESAIPEEGAKVIVFEGTNAYNFVEIKEGVYQSEVPFEVKGLLEYQLQITTANGKKFQSSQEQLPATAQLDALNALREVNDDGMEGVAMYVDGQGNSEEAVFYRFGFEETFVVMPPYFTSNDAVIISGYPKCEVGVTNNTRPESKRICYRTQFSNALNLLELRNVSESSVDRQFVRFISKDSYEIGFRYSIKAFQYVLTEGAYRYFEKLDKFSTEENIFSQVQPGFVEGNISEVGEGSGFVVGYFDLSTVTSRRIFFNFEDFFPDEPKPPFIDECELQAQLQFPTNGAPRCGALLTVIQNGSYLFVRLNENGEVSPGGPFVMAPRICGDCTVLGQPEPPDFWIE